MLGWPNVAIHGDVPVIGAAFSAGTAHAQLPLPTPEPTVNIFDADAAAPTYSSVLSLPHVVDELASQLTAAADRDPATAVPSA